MSDRPPLALPADQVVEDGDGFIITMPGSLTRNAAQCLACGNTIESIHRHDYRMCGCPNGTMVDGGLAYQRWGAVDPSQIRDLSEHGPPSKLVALNQPCPTCEGATWVDHYDAEGVRSAERFDPCPDCDGSGRLVFDLKTPCTYEWEPGEPCDGTIPDKDGDIAGYCDRCTGGYVTHRVWLDPERGIALIPEYPASIPWLTEATLPPAAGVGWYAARLRKTTQ